MGFTDEEQDNNNYSTEEYIMIDVEYVDEYQLISDKQIKDINKIIGRDNFVFVPREGLGGGGDYLDFVVNVCVNLFSEAIIIGLTLIFKKLKEKIKKKKNEAEVRGMTIHFFDCNGKYEFNLMADSDASDDELLSLIDKAKRITEILTEENKDK
ncbi:MAG: hypothetical protein MJ125_03390 [Clostridia bacterium]|nr:hypothetical protein [Clostridia bacterium]